MTAKLIQDLETVALEDRATYSVGDTIKVSQRIKEGKKERIQQYEGVVIARRNKNNMREVVTVRRIVDKIGVEKTFLLQSPLIERIDVLRRAKVRRAKLFYLRNREGTKATRLKAKPS